MRKLMQHIAVLFLLTLGLGCDKGFDELNVNPNEPTTANPDQLFTGAIYVNAGQFSTGVNSEIWTMEVWMQMMADLNGVEAGTNYNYNGSWNDALWNEWYTKVLSPCNQIIELTAEDPFLVNKRSIARILRAYNFQRITDLWGDVPYFQALSGFNNGSAPILNPVYDPQQSIYLDLLDELEEAVNEIDLNKPGYGNADALYNGDLNKWIKFGNSLRFRMAIRMTEANPSLAQQIIADLLMNEADLISNQSDGAYFQFFSGQEHPFYALDLSGQGLRNPSKYFLDLLKTSNDPRVGIYAAASPSSQALGTEPFVGVPNNKTSIELNALNVNAFTTSEVGDYFRDVEVKGTLFSYAEMCFLKSEAALYGWGGSASAETYYQEGIRAAMEWVETPSAEIDEYITSSAPFEGTLEEIIEQKWISLAYRDAYEAFAEFRRTGFPILTDENNEAIDLNQFPKRLPYPPSEWTLNGENVSQTGLGINNNSTPVWWDQ